MKRSPVLALGFIAVFAVSQMALAQAPAQCNDFLKLRDDAQKKAAAIREAGQTHKADRKQMCTLVQNFYAAEASVVKFLEVNKTWCGIPDVAINSAKAAHEKTGKFRTAACTEAPAAQAKPPTLSDAIGMPSIDSATNTKTGRGTLDTLNGNPLAK